MAGQICRGWDCAILLLAASHVGAPGLAVGAPRLSARGLGALLWRTYAVPRPWLIWP
jgi:hypothetical protein